MAAIDQEKLMMIKEETKDLSKAMNNVYNQMVFACQKKCLNNFATNVLSQEEG